MSPRLVSSSEAFSGTRIGVLFLFRLTDNQRIYWGDYRTILSGGALDSAAPYSPERRKQRSDGQRPSSRIGGHSKSEGLAHVAENLWEPFRLQSLDPFPICVAHRYLMQAFKAWIVSSCLTI